MNTKNLIPLSQYNGVILKLTAKDKKQIEQMRKQIVQLETDICTFNKKINAPKTTRKEKEIFDIKRLETENSIDLIKEKIKEIKIQRLNTQKEKLFGHKI